MADEANESEEEKEAILESEVSELKDEVMRLTEELEAAKMASKEQDEYAELLNNLFKKGIIDSQGNFVEDYQ